MKEKSSCVYYQGLIEKRQNEPLSFYEFASLQFHKLTCPACRDISIKSTLFQKHLFHSDNRRNSYEKNFVAKSNLVQDRLALFPEQNPNPIIEFELNGQISYQNPAFYLLLNPNEIISENHPLIAGIKLILQSPDYNSTSEIVEEIVHCKKYYIRKILILTELKVIRVFFTDITFQKNYEKIIESKNKEITESIRYAKTIQEAILPSEEGFYKLFPDSFIFYCPKDIVAGDFYWKVKIGDWVYIAAADCTGHGVPGALVSMVCSNALSRSVKEFTLRLTGEILDKTREIILDAFSIEGRSLNDGMDISLVAINVVTSEVQWSGANNALWYIESSQLKKLEPNKQPVGRYVVSEPFSTHFLKLKKGDSLILLTDGFTDQFGMENQELNVNNNADEINKTRKFKYSRLKNLLEKNTMSSSMKELGITLKETFNKWKGPFEQTDDVLVIGIKL